MTLAIAAVCCATAMALDGAWRGELSVGPNKLPLVFNFKASGDSASCTIDSPLQGAHGIPADVQFCSADSVALTVPSIRAEYKAHISESEIKGTFTQMGQSFTLNLKPEQALTERRPQTPRAPFPYQQIDTTFTSADGTFLAGTLTIPLTADSSPMPAVVMVTGSGPQNRDEEVFDHRPFAVIADALARKGIISFRYDDRGVGHSGGDFSKATISDFRDDAAAALTMLKELPQAGKTGMLGHSEGGTIALMLGADAQPDFVISLAGMAEKGKDLLLEQNRHALEKTAMSKDDIEKVLKLLSRGFDDIIAGTNPNDIDLNAYAAEYGVPSMMVPMLKQGLAGMQGEYMQQFVALNPRECLGKIACPVLALNGENDTQVNATRNLQIIADNVRGARIKSYPGLNHLFQPSATGEISEYESIPTTISPDVLNDIVGFILKQIRQP